LLLGRREDACLRGASGGEGVGKCGDGALECGDAIRVGVEATAVLLRGTVGGDGHRLHGRGHALHPRHHGLEQLLFVLRPGLHLALDHRRRYQFVDQLLEIRHFPRGLTLCVLKSLHQGLGQRPAGGNARRGGGRMALSSMGLKCVVTIVRLPALGTLVLAIWNRRGGRTRGGVYCVGLGRAHKFVGHHSATVCFHFLLHSRQFLAECRKLDIRRLQAVIRGLRGVLGLLVRCRKLFLTVHKVLHHNLHQGEEMHRVVGGEDGCVLSREPGERHRLHDPLQSSHVAVA
jgi:hypothetical protein